MKQNKSKVTQKKKPVKKIPKKNLTTKTSYGICPECGSSLRSGGINKLSGEQMLRCNNYPHCKWSFSGSGKRGRKPQGVRPLTGSERAQRCRDKKKNISQFVDRLEKRESCEKCKNAKVWDVAATSTEPRDKGWACTLDWAEMPNGAEMLRILKKGCYNHPVKIAAICSEFAIDKPILKNV